MPPPFCQFLKTDRQQSILSTNKPPPHHLPGAEDSGTKALSWTSLVQEAVEVRVTPHGGWAFRKGRVEGEGEWVLRKLFPDQGIAFYDGKPSKETLAMVAEEFDRILARAGRSTEHRQSDVEHSLVPLFVSSETWDQNSVDWWPSQSTVQPLDVIAVGGKLQVVSVPLIALQTHTARPTTTESLRARWFEEYELGGSDGGVSCAPFNDALNYASSLEDLRSWRDMAAILHSLASYPDDLPDDMRLSVYTLTRPPFLSPTARRSSSLVDRDDMVADELRSEASPPLQPEEYAERVYDALLGKRTLPKRERRRVVLWVLDSLSKWMRQCTYIIDKKIRNRLQRVWKRRQKVSRNLDREPSVKVKTQTADEVLFVDREAARTAILSLFVAARINNGGKHAERILTKAVGEASSVPLKQVLREARVFMRAVRRQRRKKEAALTAKQHVSDWKQDRRAERAKKQARIEGASTQSGEQPDPLHNLKADVEVLWAFLPDFRELLEQLDVGSVGEKIARLTAALLALKDARTVSSALAIVALWYSGEFGWAALPGFSLFDSLLTQATAAVFQAGDVPNFFADFFFTCDKWGTVLKSPLWHRIRSLINAAISLPLLRAFGITPTLEALQRFASVVSLAESEDAPPLIGFLYHCFALARYLAEGAYQFFTSGDTGYLLPTTMSKWYMQVTDLLLSIPTLRPSGQEIDRKPDEKWLTVREFFEHADRQEKDADRLAKERTLAAHGTFLSKRADLREAILTVRRQQARAHLRAAPFSLAFVSPPSVGKSSLMAFIRLAIANACGYDPASVFSPTPNANFQDGYYSSAVFVILDDVATQAPGLGFQDNTVEDMVRMINNIPYFPEQAAVELKGTISFESSVVFASTNVPDFNTRYTQSVPVRVLRRFNAFIEPVVKEKYRQPQSTMLDSSATEGHLDLWTYEVYRYVASGTKAVKVPLARFDSLAALSAWVVAECKKHMKNQSDLLTNTNQPASKFCTQCWLPLVNPSTGQGGDLHLQCEQDPEAQRASRQWVDMFDSKGMPPLETETEHALVVVQAGDIPLPSKTDLGVTWSGLYALTLALVGFNSWVAAFFAGGFYTLDYIHQVFTAYFFLANAATRVQVFSEFCQGTARRIIEKRAGLISTFSELRTLWAQQRLYARGVLARETVSKMGTSLAIIGAALLALRLLYARMRANPSPMPHATEAPLSEEGAEREKESRLDPQPPVDEQPGRVSVQPPQQVRTARWSQQPRVFMSRPDDLPIPEQMRTMTLDAMVNASARSLRYLLIKPVFSDARSVPSLKKSQAVAVAPHVLLLPAHSLEVLRHTVCEAVEVQIFQEVTGQAALTICERWARSQVRFHETLDLCLVRTTGPPMRPVGSLFLEGTQPSLSGAEGRLLVLTKEDDTVSALAHQLNNLQPASLMATTPESYGLPQRRARISGLAYARGAPGYSGGLVLVQQVLPGHQKGPVFAAGIHCAGTDAGTGYSQAVDGFWLKAGIADLGSGVLQTAEALPNVGPLSDRSFLLAIDRALSCEIEGTVERYHDRSMRTQVFPTLFSSALDRERYPNLWCAPNFRTRQEGDKWISPELVNLETTLCLDDPYYALVPSLVGDVLDFLLVPQLEGQGFRPLTLFESINGIPGHPYVSAMNMRTSGGFGFPGPKVRYFQGDPTERWPVPHLLQRYSALVQKYKRGELTGPVFVATLKQEPIKITKNAEGRVRLFGASSVDFNMYFRQLYLPVIAFIMHNRAIMGIAVGMNCQSPEWHQLADRLCERGQKQRILAGDYSKFDKKMRGSFVRGAFDVLIGLARSCGVYTEEELRIMALMADDTTFHRQLVRGDVINMRNSNPSGNSATVMVNSIVNLMYLAYCVRRGQGVQRSVGHDMREHMSIAVYGDDNILSSDWPWLTQGFLETTLKEIDQVYTLPSKTASEVDFVSLEEASFLKRRFKMDAETGIMMAPLEEESIARSLHWVVSGTLGEMEQSAVAIQDAYQQYFMYGREIFNERQSYLRSVAEGVGIVGLVEWLNFDEILDRYRRRQFALTSASGSVKWDDVPFAEEDVVESRSC